MRRHLWTVATIVFCVCLLAMPMAAQQNANLEQGLKPFGSYQGGNIDSVSLTNRNLTLHIPLVSYPQRGGKLRLDFFVRYNNKGWQVKETIGGGGQEIRYWEWKGKGVEVVRDQTINVKTTIMRVQNWLGDELIVNLKDAITADGSSHQLEDASNGMESVDASGLMFTGSVAMDRLGTRYTNVLMSGDSPVEPNVEDPNGNKITYNSTSGWTDTLGRLIPKRVTTTNLSGCPAGTVSAENWNLPGPNGGTSQIKLCYANYTLQPSFGIPGINEPTPPTQKFMNAIILPNQTKWQFQYNSFGDLTQITFPTGGTITYGWGTWAVCSGGATPVSRVVTSRSLNANDGAGPRTWTYGVDTVTDPAANDTVFTKTGIGDAFCSRYVSKVESYEGTGGSRTLLKTVETFYDGMDNPRNLYTSDGTAINVVTIRTKTTWPNGKVAEQTTTYDSGNTFTFWNAYDEVFETYPLVYGSVMESTASDYGSPNPGSILRRTVNTWLWTNNSNYRTRNMLDLASTVTVQDGAGTQIGRSEFLYDETMPVSSGITMQHQIPPSVGSYRGNLTSAKRWLGTNGSYPTTVTSYYDTGMPYRIWDPGSHMTEFSYSGSFYGAYVTQTCFPSTSSPVFAQHCISGNYDFNSGLLTSFTDENGQSSTYSYDNMWRFTTAVFPSQGALGSGQTNFYYPDAVTVERKQKIDGTRWTDLYVRFDGLGREIRRITANDQATPWDQVDTCYDARGLRSFVSYPYQGTGLSTLPDCTHPGDFFSYDGLGRVTTVRHSPDNTTVSTTYAGPSASVQDEGNGTSRVERITQVDGLGRLKAVCEKSSATLIGITPTPAECGLDIGGTGFLTAYGYSYDAQGNQTFTVQQGGLNPRSAIYDSLGRLTSATNPEAGAITYAYNADDLVTSRVAPTPNQTGSATVTTNYTYDELHRVRTRTYQNDPTGTPSATFNYDETAAFGVSLTNTKGRSSSAFVSNGQTLAAEVFSYDSMGRVLNNSQCTPQNCPGATFPVSYTYDLIGDPLTATPGPGVTLTCAYNIAARVTGITSSLNDGNHPGTLVSGVQYNPAGGHLAASLGNGVNETLAYDQRLRLQSLTAVKDTTTVYSFSIAAYAPNSNVLTGNDNVNGNWTYGYDDFNRLVSANKNSGQEVYGYVYDRFGNRWQQNGPHQLSLGFDANNRIVGSGVTYDAAGNVTYDGQTSYTYDAENRIISTSGTLGSATYVYNAAGMRVRKTTGGVSVDYLYDLAGNAVAELNTSGAWTRIEVYAGSRHVATYKDGPSGQTYFAHGDWLGTERARTDKNGAVTETCTNLPFGDWQACTNSISPLHFTGKQRDTETDNDYFGARYYVSRHGRWLTPDWSARAEAVPYASLANPQTLNLYAYVGNNPVSTADADGHAGLLRESRKGGESFWQCVSSCGIFSVETLPGGDVGPAVSSTGTLTMEVPAGEVYLSGILAPGGQTVYTAGQYPSAEYFAAGNYISVTSRPTQDPRTLHIGVHFRIGIPIVKNGKVTGFDYYEVLGNPGTSENQQVRVNDLRKINTGFSGDLVAVTPAQKQALVDRLNYFVKNPGECPVCGPKYNLLKNNSNTFVYNMLSQNPAGRIAPPPTRLLWDPGYHQSPDKYYE